MRPKDNMPPDPFSGGEDLTPFAANCRSMFTALVAAGFKDAEALEITIRLMCTMFTKIA